MFATSPFRAIRTFGLATGVSLIALTGVAFADMAKVNDISVEANLAAAQDTNAAAFFPEIASDIATAIQQRVAASDDAEDFKIKVDIRKIALEGDMMLPDTKQFNQLEGVAVIESPKASPVQLSFPVRVSATVAETPDVEGVIKLEPSETDFYNVMVMGFADEVVERLEGINTSGN